jgi:hypothetical protein
MFSLSPLFLGCLFATAVKAQCPADTAAVGSKFDIKFSKNEPTSNFIIDFFSVYQRCLWHGIHLHQRKRVLYVLFSIELLLSIPVSGPSCVDVASNCLQSAYLCNNSNYYSLMGQQWYTSGSFSQLMILQCKDLPAMYK